MTIRSGRLLLLGAALAAVAVMLAALHAGMASSLRESRSSGYRALLDVQVTRLQQWIDERRADVEQLASDPYVRRLAGDLAVAGERACGDQAALLADLQEALKQRFGRHAPSYVHLLDPDGRVLLSTIARRCGTFLPDEVRQRLVLARQRGSAFIRPIEGTQSGGTPLVWYEAPVAGPSGAPVAFVGYGVSALEAFGFLAAESRFGDSGEIYVIDQRGMPLSALRWPVADSPGTAPSPLLKQIEAARTAAASAPELAGAVFEPYRDYAGREVVGVWHWLPRRGIGLVLEVDADEAAGPLRYLRWLAWQTGTLALLALGGGLLLRRAERQGGRLVGPYRLLATLGEGAVSTVFLAEHILMRRQVAVKILKPHAAGDEWQARFAREARLAGKLQHGNFVRIYDYGMTGNGGFYYAMEYLDGCNFAELVERAGPQPAPRVIRLLCQVCAALEEAHGLGILHRDIKPQNLMVCTVGGQPDVVKVLDFGLVKKVDGEESRDLTVGLRILGTPAYLAPERITAPASTDPRSDLYGIGAVGFFLLTGRKPFESESDLQLTHRILHEAPPRASAFAPDVPPELDELIARCLAKEPAVRPASARALREELEALPTAASCQPAAAGGRYGFHHDNKMEKTCTPASSSSAPAPPKSIPG